MILLYGLSNYDTLYGLLPQKDTCKYKDYIKRGFIFTWGVPNQHLWNIHIMMYAYIANMKANTIRF